MKQKSLNRIIALLLILFAFNSVKAQSKLLAIDVLLDPDQTMLDSAKVYNNLIQHDYSGPGSFALDATHSPHISVLQCFIAASDLEKVKAAVAKVVKSEKPEADKLTASAFYYIPLNGLGLAGITAKPTPKLLSFQSKIIEVLKPFMIKGSNAAFVKNADEKEIATGTSEYVNTFVPDHSGDKYNPYVTIGLAHEDFLKALISKPFNTFSFKCSSVSIYHLGDFGTAQIKLWSTADKKH